MTGKKIKVYQYMFYGPKEHVQKKKYFPVNQEIDNGLILKYS